MKKRLTALLLTLILCISMLPANVFALSFNNYAEATTMDEQVQPIDKNFSDWAFQDLLVGDTYGVYPLTWYGQNMKQPISQGKIRNIMYRLRGKMLNTKAVTKIEEKYYPLKSSSTVEEVLKAFYSVISSYEYATDLGLKNKKAMDFMKENNIYTGQNGEQLLKELCSIEQACVFATRIVTCVYDKLDAASKGFFWVTKSGGNTVYMLGSIHLASNDIYPFSKEMLEAYKSSDALVVELNLFDTSGVNQAAQLAVYSDGTTLKDHLSAEVYQKTIELAAKYGYPEEMLSQFKPWYVFSMFAALMSTDSATTSEATNAASLGIDLNFTTNAMIFGKPILEAEGYLYQFQVLDSMSDKLEEYLLESTIDSVNEILTGAEDNGSDDLDTMLDLWRTGNAEEFEKYSSFDAEYEDYIENATTKDELLLIDELKDKLLTQRDKGMAGYIEKLLTSEGSNTFFVVVGSAHYISDYSVLDILKAKGYEITQIK